MTDDRNPELQMLFANAEEDLQADAFTGDVMNRVDGLERHRLLLQVCLGVAAVLVLWFLAPPLQEAVLLLVRAFDTPLVNLGNPLFNQLLLPVNNAACVAVLGLMVVRTLLRKLFHRH